MHSHPVRALLLLGIITMHLKINLKLIKIVKLIPFYH